MIPQRDATSSRMGWGVFRQGWEERRGGVEIVEREEEGSAVRRDVRENMLSWMDGEDANY